MLKPIKKLSAVDEVFNYLFEQISNGELPEGHRFPTQDAMAEEFGVSRSTIREAINKLNVLGFLTAKPGVGTIVAKSSPTDVLSSIAQYSFLNNINVREFMEARLYLEEAAIKLAVEKATAEDVLKLQHILIGQGEAIARGDKAAISRLDIEFHRAIVESGNNMVIREFLNIIWDGLMLFITEVVTNLKTSASRAYNYHSTILKHLSDRNVKMAELTMIRHLHDVSSNIETHFPEHIGLTEIFKHHLSPEELASK
ncbi:MAG: FadR family transcriptional regulator [Deltaproteobacteria bacterium]|jgi:GntR family transcriptional repressor for pyruvate dehydrogenase complex|nr:FadR family transcriptional regulator [Deltaproteobacteria bacterium]